MKHRVISITVTAPLYEVVNRYLEFGAHVTKSDFVRDAIREKIKRDMPWLYDEMLKQGGEHAQR